MPPRYNPAALAKTYTDILSAGIVRERPAWLPALELYPPGPAPTRSLTPEMTFRDPEAKQPSKTPLFPSRNMSRRQGGKLMAREVQQRPPRIRYPEDELRRKFYGEHPFELVVRPATLVEEEAELRKRVMKVWDGVEGGELNAEAWVRGEVGRELSLMFWPRCVEQCRQARTSFESDGHVAQGRVCAGGQGVPRCEGQGRKGGTGIAQGVRRRGRKTCRGKVPGFGKGAFGGVPKRVG